MLRNAGCVQSRNCLKIRNNKFLKVIRDSEIILALTEMPLAYPPLFLPKLNC